MTIDEIEKLLTKHLAVINGEIGLKKLLAGFFNEYGLLCDFTMLHSILESLEKRDRIDIIRTPATSSTGKPTTFWTEKGAQRISIRRKQS